MSARHSAQPSVLARSLEPLVAGLWILFWIWTVITAALWTTGVGEAEIGEWVRNAGLRAALVRIVGVADAIWFILAAANVYHSVATRQNLQTARQWSGAIVVVVGLIAAASALTSVPLGPIHFTTRLGLKIGPVPLALPLLWLCLIVGGRDTIEWLLPKVSHRSVAICTGLLVVLSDVLLEFAAWRVRALWIWYLHWTAIPEFPPFQNYLVWFVVVAGLAFVLRGPAVSTSAGTKITRPMMVFCALNAVFLATLGAHLARRAQAI